MAQLMPNGKQNFSDLTGAPLVGGKVYTYDAGTNTPRVTYQDAAGVVPNTNPIILDARGEALIFWSGAYKVVLRDALDNLIWTVDNVVDAGSELAADLANDTDPTLGAFLVGFSNRTVYERLTAEYISPMDKGAVGDGVANDSAAILSALGTGKIVNGEGRTYGIVGTLTPAAFAGLVNITLKQLAPTTLNCKTLDIANFTDFLFDRVKIDRGGAPGYTVGALGSNADWAGVRFTNCTKFRIGKVWITNGGRGTAIAFFSCTDYDPGQVLIDEHYWQEVNPGAPVVTDDIVQPWWFNACSRFTQTGWIVRNCTSGGPGDPTLNVAASQVRNFSRCAYGGNSKASIMGNIVDNVAQCFDFTGSDGNNDMVIGFNIARNAGVSAYKWANSSNNVQIFGNLADTPDQYGFLVSGMTEPINPLIQNIQGAYNRVRNCGGLAGKYNGNAFAFSVESQPPIDTSYPRSVVWDSCWVIDDRKLTLTTALIAGAVSATLASPFTLASGNYTVVFSNGEIRTATFVKGATTMTWAGGLASGATSTVDAPTTNVAFRNNVAPIARPTAGFNRPDGVRCVGDCRVKVPGLASANYFLGMHRPVFVGQGDGAGTDTVNSGVWGIAAGGGLTFDGTEFQDTSLMHGVGSNDVVTIKEFGRYIISAQTAFSANATGERAIRVEINGGNVELEARTAAHPTQATWVSGVFSRELYPGDEIRIMPFQNSGVPLTVNRINSSISVTRVGAP